MVKNIIEQVIVPESPRTISCEQIHVSVPLATTSNAGIASFYEEQFAVINGAVKIKSDYITSILTGNEIKQTIHNETIDKFVHNPDNLEETAYSSISGVITFKDNKGVYRKIPIHYHNKPKTIAVRDNAGRLDVSSPTGIYHAVNKQYAEDNFVPNPSELSESTDSSISGVITFKDLDGVYRKIAIDCNNNSETETIAVRDAYGRLEVSLPTSNDHAVNKKYAEDNFVPVPHKLNNLSTSGNKSQPGGITFRDSAGTYFKATATSRNEAYTIPVRASNGTIAVGNPSSSSDAATKKYVDDADIVNISITPSGKGVDGKYTIALQRGTKPALTAEIDLPLEAIKIARIEEVEVKDEYDAIVDYKLRFHFTDENIEPLEVNVGDIFSGYVTETLLFEYLDGYVSKDVPTNEGTYVYTGIRRADGKVGSGNQRVSSDIDEYSIPIRDYKGGIRVPEPVEDEHAVPKKFVKNNTMPSVESLDKGMSGGGTLVYRIWGANEYRKIEASQTIEGNGIVIRSNNHIIVPEDPTYNSYLQPNVATSKSYVDKKTAPIADNTKRIENLESTLLTFIEDDARAYEKAVPVGVGKNAVLSSIRGATIKNYLDPALVAYAGWSGYYDVYEDGTIIVDGSTLFSGDSVKLTISGLENGTYYYKVYGTPHWDGSIIALYDEIFSSGQVVVIDGTLTRTTSLGYGQQDESFEASVYFEGKIMLSKTDTEQPYVRFGEGYGKVTAVQSYGSNVLDPSLFGFPVNEDGSFTLAKDFGDWSMYEPSHTIYLEPGTYYFSYKVSNVTGNFTINAFGLTHPEDYVCVYCLTVTEAQTIMIFFSCEGMGEASADISVMLSSDPGEFEPYSAEPIDTFTIPQPIQTINGYGKEGFVLDLESKSTEYEGEVTDVSQYLTGYDKFKTIKVQGGGKVRFVNENGLAVPSEITYVKSKE